MGFRKTMSGDCTCSYAEYCCNDRKNEKVDLGKSASDVERKLVHEVYEEIASHFSETRHTPWPKVIQFLQSIPFGGILVDLGCGNGKYLGAADGTYEIGTDFSLNLLKIVRDRFSGFPL